MAKASGPKAMTKSEVATQLAEKTGLSKKDVTNVLEGLADLILSSLGKKGPGVFNLQGLAKFVVATRPATKAREGINPRTGEKITIKAKPARKTVKVRALKPLKEAI